MKDHSATGYQQRVTYQTPKNEEREAYASSFCPRHVCMRFNGKKVAYNVYIDFCRRKRVYMLETKFWSMVIGPW